MAYRIVDTEWLKNESDKVQSLLIAKTERGRNYETSELRRIIEEAGLSYSNTDLSDIRDELVVRGILEVI